MPKSTSHDDFLMKILKDKRRARAYLEVAFDDPDWRIFLIALRNVTLAQGGLAAVAARSGLNRESLYRALSEKGNPSIQTLFAVLDALEMKRPASHAPLCSFTAISNVRPIFCWPNRTAVPALQLMAA